MHLFYFYALYFYIRLHFNPNTAKGSNFITISSFSPLHGEKHFFNIRWDDWKEILLHLKGELAIIILSTLEQLLILIILSVSGEGPKVHYEGHFLGKIFTRRFSNLNRGVHAFCMQVGSIEIWALNYYLHMNICILHFSCKEKTRNFFSKLALKICFVFLIHIFWGAD